MSIVLEEKESQDWNESWREHYSSIQITEEFSICPSWEEPKSEKYIKIYPGLGFGTGEHETTELCLAASWSLGVDSFESCLDFGCGSGILGITT